MVEYRNRKTGNFSRKTAPTSSNFSKILLKFLFYILIFWWIAMILWGFLLYQKYIRPLPPITELKNMENDLAQTSTIYDRKWNILYNIYKEKRTYIGFSDINKNMINAIVAWEDKRFWTNPWFDFIWLVRAWLIWITSWEKVGWTSTISQQLIKNTLLNDDRKIERKVKEIYLSYKLNKVFSKNDILELYLNKIAFWWNAYWIEQAAQTFFWKKAKYLDILESSILASLPKWPTYYSPYSHSDRLMWYSYVYPKLKTSSDWYVSQKILSEKDVIDNKKEFEIFKSVVSDFKWKPLDDWNLLLCWLKTSNFKWFVKTDSSWCVVLAYSDLMEVLNNVRIEVWDNYIGYQVWRKDFILWRMLEDKYINFDEYKKSLLDGLVYKFKENKEKIKYPHFVFYVKDYLEEKYWKDVLENKWFKIVTTLDPELQDKAQEIVTTYADKNAKNVKANNAASITIDNKTWEIISMVWSRNYYNKEISWENNIITSMLQPWSSFKPFVYALAMEKNEIWPKTPIFDVKTKFPWWYEPKNFDGEFMNKMTLETSLGHSRNIPAIKMFYLAWWENIILDFISKLWIKSPNKFKKDYKEKYNKERTYWPSMALWTSELTPLELATAYSRLANLWKEKTITPILKIYDAKWNIIEESSRELSKEVVSSWTAYLITEILSNTSARPSIWNNYLTLKWRKVAAKTWTSTKQYTKNWTKYIFPQNLWTAGYTPQLTTVVWAWNTNWQEVSMNWDWLMTAWPIWRDIMNYAHRNLKVEDWNRPWSIKQVAISKNSWKLPTSKTPEEDIVIGNFINAPKDYDNSYISVQVDVLCNWKVTDQTPPDAIKNVFWVVYHSLRPNDPAWEDPVRAISPWLAFSNEPCERWEFPSKMQLWMNIWSLVEWTNYVELAYRSEKPVTKIVLTLDWNVVWNYSLPWKLEWGYRWTFTVPAWFEGSKILEAKVIDNGFYSKTITKTVSIWWKDLSWPQITITNPARWVIRLNGWQYFNLRWEVTDSSPLKSLSVYLDWKVLQSWIKTRKFTVSVNTNWLWAWTYPIVVEAIDINWNSSKSSVSLEILDNSWINSWSWAEN